MIYITDFQNSHSSPFSNTKQLQRGVMGSDHPRVIATIDNLGYSYSKNKDYTAALSVSIVSYLRLNCIEVKFGPYSSCALASHVFQSLLLPQQCYKEMQSAQVSHYNIFSEACCETLRKQNLMYEKLKNLNGALETTQEALLLQKTMLPPDSPVVVQAREMLAQLERKMERQGSSRSLRHV